MVKTKKRRETETYEKYWKFTAAHTDIMGTKFNNCLTVIVFFIDKNLRALEENAGKREDFKRSSLYAQLQEQIAEVSGFEGKDPALSARKVINQFVKIGFINPLLLGYHPLVRKFINAKSEEEKDIIFSKIFYERSSLASDVTVDQRELKHIHFFLKTLDHNGSLSRDDVMALMVTDITRYPAGFLTREQLDSQYRYAKICEFDERKYNQIDHLKGYLKHVVDLKYDRYEERFWFADDPQIVERDFEKSYARDGVKHRIYKEELKEESRLLYGAFVSYLDKKPYKSLIASHIKPLVDCLREGREDQAYDAENGLLLDPTVDSYFDKKDISFDDEGNILFGKAVAPEIRADLEKFSLDARILTEKRREYLRYHRRLFNEKNGAGQPGVREQAADESGQAAYTYIDLFCGAGGLSLGFDRAGFRNILAVEINPRFAETYRRNFPSHRLVIDDIKNLDEARIKELIGKENVDVIAGGPPCQGFSIAGNIGRTFLEDDRNKLFREFVRFVGLLNPRIFVLENVAAMATHRRGETLQTIIEAFRKAGKGYRVQCRVLNSADYEIAQERRRTVLVGVRADLNAEFSYPERSGVIRTIRDAIGDLPPLESGETSNVPNHTAMRHSAQMLEKMSYVKDGGDRTDIPKDLRPASGDVRKYIRYDSRKPSVCVTGDMRKIFHYEQNRALTARELARIQSFPDDFVFEGTSIQIQQQIGNAVPPLLAEKIAEKVEEALKNAEIPQGKLHRK